MRVLIIPLWVMLILIVIAWVVVAYVYWFKPKIMPMLDDYFAQRRHNRRMARRSYGNDNYYQKEQSYATTRSRR